MSAPVSCFRTSRISSSRNASGCGWKRHMVPWKTTLITVVVNTEMYDNTRWNCTVQSELLPPSSVARASFPGQPKHFWREWVSSGLESWQFYGIWGSSNWKVDREYNPTCFPPPLSLVKYEWQFQVISLPIILFLVLGGGFFLKWCVEETPLATHGSWGEGGIIQVHMLHPWYIAKLG